MADQPQSPSPQTPTCPPTVETQFIPFGSPDKPIRFPSGAVLPGFQLAYQTWGKLSPKKDNAILIFHAMTGSQHAAGFNPSVPTVGNRWNDECQIGWWDDFIGPGKIFDTNIFFIICANHLGGCYGSTGPSSLDPRTGIPYGSSFPSLTVSDIVDSQVLLLQELGISHLHAAVGGSIGGLMVLDLAVRYPHLLSLAIPIACGPRLTALQCVHNFEQIYAIESDPDFFGGDYYPRQGPIRGLALARMIAHKTFVSLEHIKTRALNEIRLPSDHAGHYTLTSNIESYMLHQGLKFVARFDANSYLHILAAWQRFDLVAATKAKSLDEVFRPCKNIRFLLYSIDTDVCFYPEEQTELADLLHAANAPTSLVPIHSTKGHDSFLLEPHLYEPSLRTALQEPALVGSPEFPL